MLNLKKFSKRTLRRDRNDDLSMITGGRPSISLGGPRSGLKNRHRQHENSMEPPRQSSGGVTLNSIPSLVKTSQSRQAVLSGKPRGILKPSSTNHLCGATPPQTQYWSTYANAGGINKTRISSTVYNMGTSRSQNKPTSTWKVCSTAPITREDASLLQREMISTMSGSQSSASYYFSATPGPPGPNNIFGRFSTPRPVHVIPSLVRSVQPPAPSPIFPILGASPATWETPTSASQAGPPNGCGVHQSEWMDRSKCMSKAPTKQYFMEQIIDILCGFATPDSIMADQLFKPLPTPTLPKATPIPLKSSENRLNATSRISNDPLNNQWNVSSHYNDKREENPATIVNDDDDDGETSVYFRSEKSVNATSPVKKKQVSFLTDSDGKLCVNEFVFNPFSQEFLSSGSSRNSAEKENMDPNFESVLPATPRATPIEIFSNEQSSTVNPNFTSQREKQTFNPLPLSQCVETTSPYFNKILPAHHTTSTQQDLSQRLSNESSSATYPHNLLSQTKDQPFNPFEDHLSERSSGSRESRENVESVNFDTVLSFPSPALRDAQAFLNDLAPISQLPELQGQLFTQDFLNSCSSNVNPEDKSMNPNPYPVHQAGMDVSNLFGSSEMSANDSFNISQTLHQLLNSDTFLF